MPCHKKSKKHIKQYWTFGRRAKTLLDKEIKIGGSNIISKSTMFDMDSTDGEKIVKRNNILKNIFISLQKWKRKSFTNNEVNVKDYL